MWGEKLKQFLSPILKNTLISLLATASYSFFLSVLILIVTYSPGRHETGEIIFSFILGFVLGLPFFGAGFLLVGIVLSILIEITIIKRKMNFTRKSKIIILLLAYGIGSNLLLNITRVFVFKSDWVWFSSNDFIIGDYYLISSWIYNKIFD